jgi:UDP-N-acetylmuramoylalanine--D-glutamate ligase
MGRRPRLAPAGTVLLAGFGVTNRAVAGALTGRGIAVAAFDDRPSDDVAAAAAALGLELVVAPAAEALAHLVAAAAMVVPSPGLPDHHPVFEAARQAARPIRSELDLAREWDDRPLLAVTGTDGKTTVTTLVAAMLESSGIKAAAVGNTEVPLVAAIDDPSVDTFVVEASSFRLAHSERFTPHVATWLNFAPDHLEAHASLAAYEAAKARIWRHQSAAGVAIGNADDVVVARHLAGAPARHVTFSGEAGGDADYRLDGVSLVTPDGDVLATTAELWRALPHDAANALAAAATALAGGASVAGCRDALVAFRGLPHRVTLVGEHGGVRWYDDSKATTPHAALAALRGFDSVVLIAGGRNKGLDLGALATATDRVAAVIAIGEAAGEVVAAFEGARPVSTAGSMAEAVELAAAAARPGDAVLLSPACASFDWYSSYAERGDDFAATVGRHIERAR